MTNEIPVPTAGPPPSPTRIEERLHPLTPFVNLWIGVVALGWFVVSSVLQGDPIWNDLGEMRERLQDMPWWVFLVAGGVVIGLGTGYWSWWTTRFVIDDQEFRLENTGAFQESKRIAFSRIQSVDVTQPFAARLLGLAQVKIDVGADDGA
ncbi:MAG: PH domain-containing protein, partial [Propioniciclava sp.]|nr:PH domain-containing protein [Propioniciclava sp.]